MTTTTTTRRARSSPTQSTDKPRDTKQSKQNKPAASYARLVDAAARRGIVGELAICRALQLTTQATINNWQARGVSKSGALDAEKYLGCAAVWVLDGIDPFKE